MAASFERKFEKVKRKANIYVENKKNNQTKEKLRKSVLRICNGLETALSISKKSYDWQLHRLQEVEGARKEEYKERRVI